jgi:predicted Zn-dependent protease with MMP-like domain
MMRFHGSDDGARDIGPGPADRYAALMFEISSEHFEELAEEVLTALPGELAAKIGNLAIIINDPTGRESLRSL